MSNRKPLDGEELLWRRVHKDHLSKSGEVTSAAFSGEEMSVDVASIQENMVSTLNDGAGVAEFEAVAAQDLGQQTVHDPLPENPAHALVIGKKTQAIKRALRDSAKFASREEIIGPQE